jgi:hypothetical protein
VCYENGGLNPVNKKEFCNIANSKTTWSILIGKDCYELWKPECVRSFNMDWRKLVFSPGPEARDKIH